MTQLAGEIADGALLNGLLSVSYTRQMVEWIRMGATKAGRSLAAFEQPQLINVSLGNDEAEARTLSRSVVTKYLGQQPHTGKPSPLEPRLTERIQETMGGRPTP